MKKYKWGILAPGKMSAKFTLGLQILENAELWAVGSRDIGRAKSFAEEYGFKKYYGSYEELAADPYVEVIYIASPHSHHREHTMLCLKNGKNVLCEKAFALSGTDVEIMITEAKKRDLFLMEALWPPFQPFYHKAKEILRSGVLGSIVHLEGWFTFIAPFEPEERKFNLSLGGSSLLDIGIYPVIDALTFMGDPQSVQASAAFAQSGSEDSVSFIFKYADGRMASLYSSFRTNIGIGCRLLCEKGNMSVLRGRDMNQHVIVEMHSGERNEFTFAPAAMGYNLEAAEVMLCLDMGMKESLVVPLDFSRRLIRALDNVRKAAGITFPGIA